MVHSCEEIPDGHLVWLSSGIRARGPDPSTPGCIVSLPRRQTIISWESFREYGSSLRVISAKLSPERRGIIFGTEFLRGLSTQWIHFRDHRYPTF